MLGVLVNTGTVLLGSTIGLLLKGGIPKKLSNAVMTALGLCTVAIGIDGLVKGGNIIILILSMIIGTVLGTLLKIDDGINKLADKLTSRFSKHKNEGERSFSEGFVTACLVFCVGSMTIVGSLQSGLTGNHDLIFTKSLLDFISSMMLSVSLGIGVIFSSIFVFLFQGALVLFSGFLSPVLGEYEIAQISFVGALMVLALGLNIIGITKLKVADYLPALIISPLLCCIPLSIFNA